MAYLKEQAISHEVPSSTCVFCSFRSNSEWRHLRDLDQSMYLHRSCLPLAEADLGRRDGAGGVADSECEGICGL